jgi:tRNA pseudouridine32 synthase/23S rRNA pseudouridine746 synthase
VLPQGRWSRIDEFLAERFPGVAASTWQQRLRVGAVTDDLGQPIAPDCPYQAGRRLYYFREVQGEQAVPFAEQVIWQDAHLLVADKPHFLAVQPSGAYLQETLLVRLKNRLGLPELSPIHRIDRDTAGLVMFSVQSATRDTYHALFRKHLVEKIYEAIAPWNPALPWPISRASRIVPSAHFMQQCEVSGTPNALTHVAPIAVHKGHARYQLRPVSGKRHQLRLHMAALGLPLVNDGIYPELRPQAAPDYLRPLQLLARGLDFVDPLDGRPRSFRSARELFCLESLEAAGANGMTAQRVTEFGR